MKKLISAAVLAIALSLPVGALAAELPPPFLGPEEAQSLQLTPQQQQAMSQVWASAHAQLAQLHTQGRAQILGALTPQQRSLLAQVVGNLAIAPNPDYEAAARQLQAALTPQQAQHILSLHAALLQQFHQTVVSAKNRADSYLTAQQRQKIQQEMSVHFGPHPNMEDHHMGMGFGHPEPMEGMNPQSEAGHVLLATAMHGFTEEMGIRVRVINH